MKEQLPKVLSISLSTWRADSGIHTQTDLFQHYDPERVAQIYTKSDLPNTPVCHHFFQISENEVLRSVYTRQKVGRRVQNGAQPDENTLRSMEEEKARYAKAHKKKSWLMTLMREAVWRLGCWKTEALDHFIREEAPDVYFVPIYPVVYMGWIQLYILKKFPKPYVCYLADDNYSYKPCGINPLSYIHRFLLRGVVRRLARNCTEMFTITKTQAEETDKFFGTHSIVLTKGIDYAGREFEDKPLSQPIRMVYTGNMLIGRSASLVEISKVLAKINLDKERVVLDIYSATAVDERSLHWLDSNGCHFHGSVPKSEVDRLQQAADIVVFVESLEKKHRMDARLSFSTKLTDYFKNGKCIFAIGDAKIAPIMYLKENDCAVIANEYAQIWEKLCGLIDDPEQIHQYARNAFETGRKNHNVKDIAKLFVEAFVRACEKRS